MENSCLRCGRCCTSFGVCVTPFDLARIASATGRLPESFASFIPEPPERERTEPAIIIDGEPVLLVLNRSETNVCHFYSGKGCAIYDIRPMLCRTYPFRTENNKLAEMRSRACPQRWLPGCEGGKAYLADCARYGSEVALYKKMAEEWNGSGGGDFAAFLAFAVSRAGLPEARRARPKQ